jgi:2-oxoglutarate dehydrogenase E1 component
VLPDPDGPIAEASRVLLCSGKIAHELMRERAQGEGERARIVRIEQLHPLPADELRALLAQAPARCPFAWVQEEPENMGAWYEVRRVVRDRLRVELTGVTREESASPATGSLAVHQQEQEALLDRAFEGLPTS